MINFTMVGYYVSDCGCKNNEFVKLKRGGYKTPAQLEKEGYKVVQFHGIVSDQEVRHTGYVFIRGKEVTIAYRGTCDSYDFKRDVEIPLIRQYELLPKGGKIHLGFYSVFENSWESLYGILKGYANDRGLEIRDLKINLTGHSMGGAVANIAALCLSVTEDAKDLHIATFGAPRVFDCNAAKVCNGLFGRKTIRVVDRSDFIPSLPPNFMGYKHVGKQLKIGRHSVPALHDHKLEVYHNLILKIKPKNFKSDNNTSATCYILSRAAREVYDVLTVPSCLIPSTHSSSDKQYFERVKNQHKNASFSKIINRHSELGNKNDKFLDKDRRNGIMGDIRASIKKPRGNNNKEGVMTKFKEQSEKSVGWGGGLSNIDNLTNSKERSVGKMTNFEEQNRGNMTGLAESFENWADSGEIPGIGGTNNLEESRKKSVRKSVSYGGGLSNVDNLTDSGLDANKKKSLSFSGGLSKIRKRLNPKKKKQSNKRLNSSEALPETRRWNLENLVDAIKKFDSETVELIMKRNAIVMHESTKSILQEAINEAKTEIGNLQGEEKNRQGSELKKIEELFKGSLSEIQTNQGKAIEGTFFNAIEDANFEAVKLIMELGGIKATEPILQAALKKANEKYGSGELRKKDKQEIREIIDFLSAKLSEIQNDHVPSINVLNRAELEKARSEKIAAESTELEKVESEAEFERLAAASTELEKAESEAEFEKLAAVSTELEKAEFERIVAESAEREKVESEAKFEKLASVQDLYLDHAQPVNANISEEDVNSTTSDQITPVGSDELDSSSGEPLYSTIDSGSSDPQLDGQQSPQSEILTNTLDDDVSSLSSDEHSSASSNAGDTSTTENVIDNEEEPVVDDKDDQPAGKEGDSKSPVTFIIEGDDNKVVFEQDNSVKTHPQNAKLPVIATWTSAITGVLTGAAAPVAYFAFSASLLVAGIIAGVGACCLVAAVVIYCCTPKSQVENNEVEKPFNMKEELTVTSV